MYLDQTFLLKEPWLKLKRCTCCQFCWQKTFCNYKPYINVLHANKRIREERRKDSLGICMSRLFPTPLCTFQKISKQKFEYKTKKSFLTPFRWCYDRQTNSFIPLSLLDFCNPQCRIFFKVC